MNRTKPYSIFDVAKMMDAVCHGEEKIDIVNLTFDSRKVVLPSASLFFALETAKSNGHNYIESSYIKGVRGFVVSSLPKDLENYPNSVFLKVDNTLEALHKLTQVHRDNFNLPVVGVTGSYGKTIVKEWINHLLDTALNTVRSPKSYNSQIGVPISIWNISEAHQIGIFEAGISQSNEMDLLERIIRPTIGVFTNVGKMHEENFSNTSQQIQEKLQLFKNTETVIYCKDHIEIEKAISNRKNTFSWSTLGEATLSFVNTSIGENKTIISGIYDEQAIEITVPFIDPSSIENAIHSWCVAIYLNLDSSTIKERMISLPSVAMRLQLKEGINNCSIVNDSYNLDINSLNIALDFLNQQNQHPKKVAILSDIRCTSKDEEQIYKEVASLLNGKGIDRLIGIGVAISRYENLFNCPCEFHTSTTQFLKDIDLNIFNNETILLKGAFNFSFSKIEKVLQQKTHNTILEIDLNAVTNNLNYFKASLKPKIKLMVVVKAFSYGSGSFEIANILQYHNVDYLAVAYVDEGVELRKAGIRIPIMVMNPANDSINVMVNYNLEPEIYSLKTLNELITYSTNSVTFSIPIHIKIDSGMHRLGFEEKDTAELIAILQNHPELEVKSIFSHLSGSDDEKLDDHSKTQYELFDKMSSQLKKHLGGEIIRHILNTNGIVRFPEYQLDMVRLGMGLHGISNHPIAKKNLLPTSSLKSSISQIKRVSSADKVGYGTNGLLKRDTTLATIPIGYADGLRRSFGKGKGNMFVNGKLAPSIGDVCMDMTMIDITEIDANEGDEVEIFGPNLSILKYSSAMDTIPYEVLTDISRRVKRVYYQE
ncbi:MAG: bifunctional UDP-N-acetylmuramoyl-tripeptide:D-alanyl-D-alanine ligase/alanine racemase [Flavobacteriales bacterium]|nr:bifunctional UDP-N-acetylmuramoyl-tripeptide:D-alanyl-D-alanine ligase/alanine racemase [Flavobacteriales bacterium]